MTRLSVRTTTRCEFRDITDEVAEAVRASGVADGVAVVYCPHTTAGITINENADPSVVSDFTKKTSALIERDYAGFTHSEGNSDAHIKSSLVGASETVIISGGRLELGTWQGIYFAEFDGPRTRSVLVKVMAG